MSETQDLIGPKPEPQPSPRFQTPFRVAGDHVKDANDETIIVSECGRSLTEDREIAAAVAAALNAKYEPANVQAVATGSESFQGRVLVHRSGDRVGFPNGARMPFAYEVAPGRFWWAKSREAAMRETEDHLYRGWAADSTEELYDVTDPFGPQVITE